jgi:hypothetical protein
MEKPMTELEMMQRAKMYLDKLAQGIRNAADAAQIRKNREEIIKIRGGNPGGSELFFFLYPLKQ